MIAQAKVTRVEWRNLGKSTLFLKSIARMSSLARDKVRFTRLKPVLKINNNSSSKHLSKSKKKVISYVPRILLKKGKPKESYPSVNRGVLNFVH